MSTSFSTPLPLLTWKLEAHTSGESDAYLSHWVRGGLTSDVWWQERKFQVDHWNSPTQQSSPHIHESHPSLRNTYGALKYCCLHIVFLATKTFWFSLSTAFGFTSLTRKHLNVLLLHSKAGVFFLVYFSSTFLVRPSLLPVDSLLHLDVQFLLLRLLQTTDQTKEVWRR